MPDMTPAATMATHALNQRVSALRSRQDLKLPKPFKTAFDRLAKLEMLRMTTHRDAPSRETVVAATVRDLEVDMTALAEVELFDAKVAVIDSAIDAQKGEVEILLHNHAPEVMDEIRRVIYDPALARIKALAERVSPDQTPADLLRSGHRDLAQEYVECEVLLDRMTEALQLRTLLFGSPVTDGNGGQRFSSSLIDQFRPPDLAAAVFDNNRGKLANPMAAIAHGAEPWCAHPMAANARRADYMKEAMARAAEANKHYRPAFGSIG